MTKDAAGRPRWICDAPVSTLSGVAELQSLVDTIQADAIYITVLSEGEGPLVPELIEAFERMGIDIVVPHDSRAPFVAIGGRFLADYPPIADVAEKGTAALRFGQFPDPRNITLAVDRITLTSVGVSSP